MLRAIELAKLGAGNVSPNPLVGAVIAKNNKIIGEGYHMKYGENHAEVNALKNATSSVEGADIYVTLEPCSHYGNTPPCAKAIAESGIKRVYIGTRDPNPKVSGKGIEILKSAGIDVIEGVCEKDCRELNQVFFKYISTSMPYVILKYAMTLDGKIATVTGDSKWISNELSREYVHNIRGNTTGIMVGINTVIKDDPLLTCRINGKRNPIRIIVDTRLRIPENSKVLKDNNCIIATDINSDENKIKRLSDRGIRVIKCNTENDKIDLSDMLKQLGKLKIDSILLEGGGTLNYSFISNGLVDKVIAFIAPKIVGGSTALSPVEGDGIKYIKDALELGNVKNQSFDNDICIEAYVRRY